MQRIRLNQKSPNFYELLGPVFGSRTIEQETNDRFYDDAEKEWFLLLDQDAYLGIASVSGKIIKNFWAVNADAAEALLREILSEGWRLKGIVPRTHERVFARLGFRTGAYRKNFIEVHYEKRNYVSGPERPNDTNRENLGQRLQPQPHGGPGTEPVKDLH